MCKRCEIEIPFSIESKYDGILSIIEKVFKKVLKAGDVVESLYLSTAKTLFEGVEKGYGKKLINIAYNSPDYLMLNNLRTNVYVFSAFKTYQELRAMTDLLIDGNGAVKDFDTFKKEALALHADYDIRFLQAEYDHAVAGSQMASKWQRIQEDKEALPYLRYDTAGDDRVRPAHQELDNIILPVDHPFWNTYYPPLGWRCRCDVTQVDRGRITTNIPLPEIQPMFRNNIGKSGVLFPESHPYFTVNRADRERASRLFDLPLPESEMQPNRFLYKKYEKDKSFNNVLPLQKNGGFVFAHVRADKNDLTYNIGKTKILAKTRGDAILINEHSDSDGVSNPELTINGLLGDIKTPKHTGKDAYKTIENAIYNRTKKCVKDQKGTHVVFVIEKRYTIDGLIKGIFQAFKIKELEEMTIMFHNDNSVRINRDQFESGLYVKVVKGGFVFPKK